MLYHISGLYMSYNFPANSILNLCIKSTKLNFTFNLKWSVSNLHELIFHNIDILTNNAPRKNTDKQYVFGEVIIEAVYFYLAYVKKKTFFVVFFLNSC